MAPLWLVQATLELGALGASLRLGRTQLSLMLRIKGAVAEPEGVARARRIWPELSYSQEGDLCCWVFRRRGGRAQLHREKIWLQQRARFCPSPFKVIGYLLQVADSDVPSEIALPTSKQVIASRLNLTPETLSRIFHDLSDAGLISVQGKRITLHDPARLSRYNA